MCENDILALNYYIGEKNIIPEVAKFKKRPSITMKKLSSKLIKARSIFTQPLNNFTFKTNENIPAYSI